MHSFTYLFILTVFL